MLPPDFRFVVLGYHFSSSSFTSRVFLPCILYSCREPGAPLCHFIDSNTLSARGLDQRRYSSSSSTPVRRDRYSFPIPDSRSTPRRLDIVSCHLGGLYYRRQHPLLDWRLNRLWVGSFKNREEKVQCNRTRIYGRHNIIVPVTLLRRAICLSILANTSVAQKIGQRRTPSG